MLNYMLNIKKSKKTMNKYSRQNLSYRLAKMLKQIAIE
jgi:hypothetical protein